jgi:N-acetylmuramoyl-L-alanine amidase
VKKHLVIIVGHNSRSQGAIRTDTGESEWAFNSRVADRAAAYASAFHPGLTLSVLHRQPDHASTGAEIRQVYQRADEIGADATIELHFNAAETVAARGCETLHAGSARGAALAESVQAHTVKMFPGLKDRGLQKRTPPRRGGMSLTSGRAPAVIVEPFFGSNPQDCATFYTPDAEKRLARAWIDGAVSALEAWYPGWRSVPPPRATPSPVKDGWGAWVMRSLGFRRVTK